MHCFQHPATRERYARPATRERYAKPATRERYAQGATRHGLRSAVSIPPQECYLDWPGDQYRGPKAEDVW